MTIKETIAATGSDLLHKIKQLIEEGNVRKISIHNKEGRELMSFPLTIGVVGAVFAPVLAAVGALAAMIGDCTLSVEREVPHADAETHMPDLGDAAVE